MISDDVKSICRKISLFFLNEEKGDYDRARVHIESLGIRDITLVENKVTITAAYIGKIIGKRGLTIDALTKFIGMEIKIVETKDDLAYYLTPFRDIDSIEDGYMQSS